MQKITGIYHHLAAIHKCGRQKTVDRQCADNTAIMDVVKIMGSPLRFGPINMCQNIYLEWPVVLGRKWIKMFGYQLLVGSFDLVLEFG